MATIRDELEHFQQFVSDRLAAGSEAQSLDELFDEWLDLRERDAVNAAIRRGLRDIEEGRFEPVEEFNRKLGEEFGFDEP